MAQVSKALKFRTLCAQLTPTETKLFISNVMFVNGTVLFSALFHLILSSCTYKDIDADCLNHMVSNIILCRKKKQKTTAILTRTINGLPPALIGHTASFLPQSDYIKLSTCTRSLFIGCNTPNQMQELVLFKREWKHHPIIDLAQFPSIKRLAIHFDEFRKLSMSDDVAVCRELNTITLNADRVMTFSAQEMESFREQKLINMSNITTLTLAQFGRETRAFDHTIFHMLLSTSIFGNIQCLNLRNVICHFDPKQMKQLLPSLSALSVRGGFGTDIIALIHEFAKQLKYLSMWQNTNANCNFSTVPFDKLEQLILLSPSFQTLHDILETAVELRYCAIHMTYNKIKRIQLNEVKQCMVELITSCKSLEYIYVNCTNVKKEWFEAICGGIEYGLFATNNWIRDQLWVKIIFEYEDVIVTGEIVFMITQMIAAIQRSRINDFLFAVLIRQKGVNISETLLPQLIQNIPGDVTANTMNIRKQHRICITNKQCKINGYNVSWMM
eukprot:1138162_1